MFNDAQYTFHSDPGHGWLEVPIEEIIELGIEVTPYSYRGDDVAYLEEDVDAPRFTTAYRQRFGHDLVVDFKPTPHGESFIRWLPRYS